MLVQLSEAPEHRLRPFQICEALNWEQSRLSHQLTRMERRGLVARQECKADGRGAFIELTAAGADAIGAAAPRHVAAVRRLVFDRLSDAQRAAFEEACADHRHRAVRATLTWARLVLALALAPEIGAVATPAAPVPFPSLPPGPFPRDRSRSHPGDLAGHPSPANRRTGAIRARRD